MFHTKCSFSLGMLGFLSWSRDLILASEAFGELAKIESSGLYPQTYLIRLSRGGIQESAFFYELLVLGMLKLENHCSVCVCRIPWNSTPF